VGRWLTYIGESLGFILGFRVGGKREGKWAAVRKRTRQGKGLSPRGRKCFKSFLFFHDLDLNEFRSNSNKSFNFF
jgi:hypothetical protein